MAAQRFELWCGQAQRPLTDTQKEIIRQIVSYIVTNGSSTLKDVREYDKTVAAQIIKKFRQCRSSERSNPITLSIPYLQ